VIFYIFSASLSYTIVGPLAQLLLTITTTTTVISASRVSGV